MKKLIALLTAIIMAGTMTTGCGNNKKDSDNTTLTYWTELNPAASSHIQSMNEMLMYQELEKRTGIKINFIHPPTGQASEQFNLLIASGKDDLPDIIEYKWPAYSGGPEKAINDGIIIGLNDLVDNDAPNFKKALDSKEIYKKQSTTDNGLLYGFPSLNVDKNRTFGGMIIRKDWLDDLGLKTPETISEWENVLRAFKEKKKAAAPLTLIQYQVSSEYHFNNAFNVGLTTYLEDNKVKMVQLQPGYKGYIELMHKWYMEGLLDSDFDTNNSTVIDAKMTNGTSGVTYGTIGGSIGRYINAMKDKDPKYNIVAAQYPVMNKGDEPKFMDYQNEANPPFAAITTNCKNPKAAVKLLDYFYSEDGDILKNYGVEGKTYNKKDGHYEYTDEILHNQQGLSIAEAMAVNIRSSLLGPGFCQHDEYLKQYYQLQEQKDALKIWSKYGSNAAQAKLPPITFTLDENEEIVPIRSEIGTYTDEMMIKFIKGTESLENYDGFINQLKKMGINRLQEIYQQAVDRYNKR